ncbi:MAG: ATP-grasp domain-containing protein [Bradyrhizobium sp.]|nr:ATP-grasp domain-containing protein [Bradyrhizobium sp.]
MKHDRILYLTPRSFSLERDAEITAARERGFDLLIATTTTSPIAGVPEMDVIRVPFGDSTAVADAIVAAIQSSQRPVSGVVAWTDPDVEVAAQLSRRLGIRALSPEAASTVRNKAATRRVLDKVDGANPRYATVSKESEVRAAVAHAGPDCLLKPAGASGGRGIFRIRPEDDPLTIYREMRTYCVPSRDSVYGWYSEMSVIEEYITGTEHSVAGFLVDGKIHVLAVTDKAVATDLPYQYQTILPSRLTNDAQELAIDIARAAVRATEIDQCGFHVDMMMASSGPKVLEIGGRLGGECINSHLIPLAYGSRPYEAVLDLATGGRPSIVENPPAPRARAAFRHLIPSLPGRIVALEGLDRIAAHPNVRAFVQTKKVGEVVHHPRDKYNSLAVGFFVASFDVDTNVAEALEDIARLARIEVDPVA